MAKAEYLEWLEKADIPEIVQELKEIEGDEKAIEDRFYKKLEFGTGGLRGVLGAGTNRMNEYTVGRATFGLANYLLKTYGQGKAVIAYDSRKKSREFAFLIAKILSSFKIQAYVFEELMPTPVLSFAVRHLKASMGVVITASHNPKEYNGYKVYNEHGCQITNEAAEAITREIDATDGYFRSFCEEEKYIHVLGEEVLDAFLEEIQKYSLFSECGKYCPEIVYSPLHGTGNKPVRRILAKIGVRDVTVVPEQELPDPEFTTCPYPNPEERSALDRAIALAQRKGAPLVLATDPDADRVGIAVRASDGQYRLFNGNETGILLLHFVLTMKRDRGLLQGGETVIKTIVTTDTAFRIAEEFGVRVKEVLTGFKYIGEQIDLLPRPEQYVFGLEESYGYLVGVHARDKDAVSASMLIAEMAAYYAKQGKTLIDALYALYDRYGYMKTALYSKEYKGKDGKEAMNGVIRSLRNAPPAQIGGRKVERVLDYLNGIDGLPVSDVLSYSGQGFKVIVRPSGTEPKLKAYFMAEGEDEAQANALLSEVQENFCKIL